MKVINNGPLIKNEYAKKHEYNIHMYILTQISIKYI